MSIGLNCALGAKELRPYIEVLNKECPFLVSTHPNAGLPNALGGYDQSATEFADLVEEFASQGWINIVGGCCGTTPAHIAAAAKAVRKYSPRPKPIFTSSLKKWKTNYKTASIIEKWLVTSSPDSRLSIEHLLSIVSRTEDKKLLDQIRTKFNAEKNAYHSEQVMLVNAHLLGKFQSMQAQ